MFSSCSLPHRQRASERRQDAVHLEGLQYVIECACLERFDRSRDRAMSGHHDAGQVAVDLMTGAQQRDAVHLRHHQIGQQQIEWLLAQCRHRLEPGGEPAW